MAMNQSRTYGGYSPSDVKYTTNLPSMTPPASIRSKGDQNKKMGVMKKALANVKPQGGGFTPPKPMSLPTGPSQNTMSMNNSMPLNGQMAAQANTPRLQ